MTRYSKVNNVWSPVFYNFICVNIEIPKDFVFVILYSLLLVIHFILVIIIMIVIIIILICQKLGSVGPVQQKNNSVVRCFTLRL